MYTKRSSIAKQHETTGQGAHGSAVHEHPFRVEKEQSMKKMGAIEGIIRVILAVVFGILYVTGQISGLAAVILGVFAVIFDKRGCILSPVCTARHFDDQETMSAVVVLTI